MMKALIEIAPPMPELTPAMATSKPADEARQHGAEREAQHRVAVDVHAHELRRLPVLGQRAHGPAGLGVLHEQQQVAIISDCHHADQ